MIKTTCCVVGGGPAGMMTGLLMARAGVETVVIEKHGDFLRDFRGDTIHPSTTQILAELGMLERFLEMNPDHYERLNAEFSGEKFNVADFSALPTRCKYIAFIPQWDFLDFLTEEAAKYPTFSLRMNTKAVDLIESDGIVRGVKAETEAGDLEIEAGLVIAADGRSSKMRDCAGFKVHNVGAPIDVLWFRLPRHQKEKCETLLHAGPGHIVITIDRGSYWQCAFVIPKGGADEVKKSSLGAFKTAITTTAPILTSSVDALENFDDVRLLNVAIDRLGQWSRPGLLMIGDAAHAMSPIGGVGINLAIQDAVAAANLLAWKLEQGALTSPDLAAVRRRRLLPIKLTQWFQVQAQNRILDPIISDKTGFSRPRIFGIINRFKFLQRLIGFAIGLGARQEHVRSPLKHKASK